MKQHTNRTLSSSPISVMTLPKQEQNKTVNKTNKMKIKHLKWKLPQKNIEIAFVHFDKQSVIISTKTATKSLVNIVSHEDLLFLAIEMFVRLRTSLEDATKALMDLNDFICDTQAEYYCDRMKQNSCSEFNLN